MPPSVIAFDNSSLAIYKDCPRKYYYAIVLGYRPAAESLVLRFGELFHRGVELYEKSRVSGLSHNDALKESLRVVIRECQGFPFQDSKRNPFTLLRTLVWFLDDSAARPMETVILPNGKPALELSFRFELPIKAPGEDINDTVFLYCGHIDRIVQFNGLFYCVDYKTTTSSITPRYFERYSPNAQISGYTFACKVLFSKPVSGFIIEAIQIGATFSRSTRYITTRTGEQLDEWLENTIEWISRIEYSKRSNSWPMNEESCAKYGSCQFREVCNKTPSVRENFLRGSFVYKPWNPLASRG